jgi:hypothetical protein
MTAAAGERDAGRSWAQLRDLRCRNSEEEIAEQLCGHWREDHLFSLRQALQMYDAIQQRIADYDWEILRKLSAMQPEEFRKQPAPRMKNLQKARSIQKRGQEPIREALYRMSGVDFTRDRCHRGGDRPGGLSEYGPNLSRFPTEKEFVSHVAFSPRRPMREASPTGRKSGLQRARVWPMLL